MADAGAVLLDEAGDGAVGLGALQELQLAVAAGQEGHFHLLLGNDLIPRGLEAQALIKLYGLVQIFHGDANMVNTFEFHSLSSCLHFKM